jgi:diguanylate cyclase (GGDEF)-like protein
VTGRGRVGPIFHPLPWLRLPRSLRGQFAAVLAVLSLMIVAGAVAAVYALRTSSAAALQLAQQRLERMHDAQAIVEQTLHLEREADRVLAASSPPALHESYAALLAQSEMLDQLVAAFAQTSDNVAVLDLYQASQLLRNTANVVVQLRRNALEPGHSAAAHGQLERFHDEMRRQASAIVETARQQSGVYDRDFQGAVNGLVATAKRSERWILALLSGSLVFAGLVARLILGRYLLWRLQRISQHLRRDHADDRALDELASGGDEIAEMACAVRQFLADRQALEQRTAELCLTQEQLTEQGRILEMIATRAPLPGILEHLVRLIESQLQGITGSILLLDADGLHLRHGAAPGLPESYSRAIDGQRIGPRVGSCGTAMYRRETVIVADVRTDPLWEDWRGVAAAYGLRSCWSVPITSPEGEVLGSFALYSSTVRHPDAREMCRIEMAVRIAGISIERQRAEQRIRHMAHHDELTGLPNRALLNDRMAQALARSRRGGRPVAVLFLDLDGFKFINDSLGHAIGDRLLVEVAARLEASVRQGDTVARLGGDEFVVMLVDMEQADDAALVAQNILHALAQPVLVEGETLHVTTSIGVAVHPADGGDAETLLKHADAAMYRAKEQGRNAYQCYTGAIGARARQYACHRAHPRRRGADPLAPSGTGPGVARPLHPAGRGNRTHRADRRVGAAHRLSPASGVAQCQLRGSDDGGESVATPVARPRRCPTRALRAVRHRLAGRGPGAGAHRKRSHPQYRGGRCDAARAQVHRSEPGARRFRHRLLQPEPPASLSDRRDQDRQVLHLRRDRQRRGRLDRPRDHRHGAFAGAAHGG